MIFIIKGMKYDTDKMEHVADVKKMVQLQQFATEWFFGKRSRENLFLPIVEIKKGNWLLTHEIDCGEKVGQAIKEDEAKELLVEYAIDKYEELFGKIPEA